MLRITIVLMLWIGGGIEVEARNRVSDKAIAELGIQLPKLAPPAHQPYHLLRRLREFQKSWKVGRKRELQLLLKNIHEQQYARAIPNFFSLTKTLLNQGDLALAKGQYELARLMYEGATRASPVRAEPWFRLAWLTIKEQPLALIPAVQMSIEGIKRLDGDLYQRYTHLLQLFLWLLLALSLAFFVYWIVLMLHRLPLLMQDLLRRLPAGITRLQLWFSVFAILVLAWFWGASWLELALLCLLFSWFYQSKRERLLSMCGVLLLAGLPWFMPWLEQSLTFRGSRAEMLYLVNESEFSEQLAPRLSRALEKNPRHFELLFSTALYYKRRGDFGSAREFFMKALKVRKTPELMVNLGNLDFIARDGSAAFKRYRKALKMRPRMMEAHYNVSLLLKHSSSITIFQQKADALEAAQMAGGAHIERFIKRSKLQTNRYVIDAVLPSRRYGKLHARTVKNDSTLLMGLLWGPVSGWIPLDFAKFAGGALILLLLLLVPVGARFFPARYVEVSKSRGASSLKGVTGQRVEMELAQRRWERRQSRWRLLFGLCCLGAGHLVIGRTLRGFAFLLCLCAYISLCFHVSPWVPDPWRLQNPFDAMTLWVGGMLCGLLYLLSLRTILSRR